MKKSTSRFVVRESRINRQTFNVIDTHRVVAVRMWLSQPKAIREADALNRVGAA